MSRRVRIVPPNPEWPTHYSRFRRHIQETIGQAPIEHMGSTSVPGLGAKNIIDIMAGVPDRETANKYQKQLEKAGYTDVTPEPDHQEWFYCISTVDRNPGVHLHLVITDSNHWKRQLAFRDILRADPEIAREYYKLKKDLAEKHGSDREAYTDAKTEFIEETLRKAGTPA